MQIEVKGRNTPVTDELGSTSRSASRRWASRSRSSRGSRSSSGRSATRRSPSARSPRRPSTSRASTLRARDRARDMRHAINLCEEELARQVKRHRDKRRERRKARAASIRTAASERRRGHAAAG